MKKTATLNDILGFLKGLTSQFFLLFLLLFSFNSFAQGPGCPNVDAGEDVELDCDQPCTDLTASFLQTGETTSYEVSSIDYAPPFPSTGGTPVSVNTDDVWSDTIPLPFDFCFYGTTYTEMLIGSNGVVTFDLTSNDPGGYCAWSFDAAIPSTDLFFATIFGPYMDIDPSVSGSGGINYAVFGESPCRTMVVNFPSVPYFSCNEINMTTQIVIYENTNVVEVYLENRSDQCSNWNDGNAVIGLQNQDGTEGIVAPGRNTGNWAANNEAWRFTPNGASNVDFTWLNENNEVIGTDPTINVCPTSDTTVYTAQAIYTNCNGDVITETDDVTISLVGAFSLDLGGDQEFCDADEYTITAELVGVNPTDATFLWSNGESSQSIAVTETGVYSVDVTVGACTLTQSVTVTFDNSPIFDLGGEILVESCFEIEEIVIDASPTNMDPANATYLWSTGETTPTIIVSTGGIYSVVVTAGNCSSEGEVTVTIIPASDLEISVGDDFKSCIGEEWTITSSTSEDGVTYQWLLNNGILTGETGSSIDIVIDEGVTGTQTYTVIITKGECTGTDSLDIDLYDVENCIITQGISPNGSIGLNDELDLEFLSDRTGISKLQIFNRFGTLVYEKDNYINEWMGQTDDGDELPTGTYYYVLDLLGEDSVYGSQPTGWIYLNRDAN